MIKECLHCKLDTKSLKDDFCCLGCKSAYQIINEFGLENYYNIRQLSQKERNLKPENEEKIDISQFVEQKDGEFEVNLMIQGLHCAACVWLIESILKRSENVAKARINLSKRTLFLKWQGDLARGNELVGIIADLGYKLLPFDEKIIKEEEKKYDNYLLKTLAVAGFGAGNVMLFSLSLWFFDVEQMGFQTRNLLNFFSFLIAIPVIIYSSYPFFSSAFKSVKNGHPNMDLAISSAIFLSCLISIFEVFHQSSHVYFDSAIMLIFFLSIGRYLDFKARKKAFNIALEFNLLNASFGRVLDGQKIKILPIKDLKKGMILIVAAGEKIAADGVVIEGEGEIDTSLITGESNPRNIALKSEVFAGNINLFSPIKVEITKSTDESLLSQIIKLSNNIENNKNHYVRLADRLVKFYLPTVHVLAFSTFLFWLKNGLEIALNNAVAVLIITCPCALALAIPIVQTIAVSNFIKKLVLIKSGQALEEISEISTIVFDKTGSLTLGKPKLKDIFGVEDDEKEFYLKIAASIAKNSKHPISNAIFNAYDKNLENLQVEEVQGFGLKTIFENKEIRFGKKDFCAIKSDFKIDENLLTCFMKIGEKEICFTLEDEVKEDAFLVVKTLQNMGKKVILLSGDVQKNVEKMAQDLNIEKFYFEKTPIEKIKILEEIKEKNEKLIMVGDGLNDAPSLALADVSISFCSALNISQNVSDIIIKNDKLMPIVELFNSSKKSIKLMKQNLAIALIYNLIAVPFAISGNVVPLGAAIAMSSSSLLVLFNSLRMRK